MSVLVRASDDDSNRFVNITAEVRIVKGHDCYFYNQMKSETIILLA